VRPELIQIVAWQVILACAGAGISAGQATGTSEPEAEVEIVHLLGIAESDYHQAHGRYATLAELLGSGQLKRSAEQSGKPSAFQHLDIAGGEEPVAGFSLDLMVALDGAAYKLSLTPKTRTCMMGWFTDNTGAVYEGKPIGCKFADTDELKLLESARTHDTGTPLAVAAPRDWAPPDVDQTVPPARQEASCPLSGLLAEVSKHAEELVENLQRFSAKERIEHIEFGKNDETAELPNGVFDYVAQIRADLFRSDVG
jgi:hypothetical protein